MMIDYDIISTGSKGNAVVLCGDILIDCGVPYRALRDTLPSLRLVLLTHAHGDHFNRTTLARAARERPTLRIGCCPWMVSPVVSCGVDVRQIDVLDTGGTYIYGNYAITPEPLFHDVPNCGYHIHLGVERKNIFYATDTSRIDHVVAPGYDLYLLEANYGEGEIVERIRRKQEAGEYVHEWSALENHLSREKAEEWLYSNMNQNSMYILLHEHEERDGGNYDI